jgi:hypothetical protein
MENIREICSNHDSRRELARKLFLEQMNDPFFIEDAISDVYVDLFEISLRWFANPNNRFSTEIMYADAKKFADGYRDGQRRMHDIVFGTNDNSSGPKEVSKHD